MTILGPLVPKSPPLREDGDGVVRVGTSHITLDKIIAAYDIGMTAEEICRAYEVVRLADVYAILSYYLDNRNRVQDYLAERKRKTVATNHIHAAPDALRFLLEPGDPGESMEEPRKTVEPDPAAAAAMLKKVRQALGRTEPLKTPPVPPTIDEHVARLVYSEIGLPELFQKRATDMKMLVELCRVDDLLERMLEFLKEKNCASAMLSDTPILNRMNVCAYLNRNGIKAANWRDISADDTYDIDAGITEADYAVAETGTLAITHRPQHGRLLSLVPFVHVAVIEPKKFLPDLIDLFEKLKADGVGSGVTLISGPSKTADIEMNTVTGVHGPNVVKTFVLA